MDLMIGQLLCGEYGKLAVEWLGWRVEWGMRGQDKRECKVKTRTLKTVGCGTPSVSAPSALGLCATRLDDWTGIFLNNRPLECH